MFRGRGWRWFERGAAVVLLVSAAITTILAIQGAASVIVASAASVAGVAFGMLAIVVAFDRLRIRNEANELRSRLERALAEDPETGISSLATFRRDITTAMARFKRKGERFTLVVFRVPYQSELASAEPNIRDLARELTLNLRQEDTLARVGDRELGALLTGTGSEAAENFLLRVDFDMLAHRAVAGLHEWTREVASPDDLLRHAREDLARRNNRVPLRAVV